MGSPPPDQWTCGPAGLSISVAGRPSSRSIIAANASAEACSASRSSDGDSISTNVRRSSSIASSECGPRGVLTAPTVLAQVPPWRVGSCLTVRRCPPRRRPITDRNSPSSCVRGARRRGPNRSACPRRVDGGHRACAARRWRCSPGCRSPGTRGSNRAGGSTPPTTCCWRSGGHCVSTTPASTTCCRSPSPAPPPSTRPPSRRAPWCDSSTALMPAPAYVLGPHWEFVGWNAAQARLYPRIAELEPPRRNLLWVLFADPADPRPDRRLGHPRPPGARRVPIGHLGGASRPTR